MDEFDILYSICRLLNMQAYRLRQINRSNKYELLATMRSSCFVYIRIDGAFLEFYVKLHGNHGHHEQYKVYKKLDLADPKSLTRANLRAAIKAAQQEYWEEVRRHSDSMVQKRCEL